MIVIRSVYDIQKAPLPVRIELQKMVGNAIKEASEDLFRIFEDFDFTYGGAFYIVETPQELQNIPTDEHSEDGTRHLTLGETASTYELAYYLPDKSFACLVMITSNSGGDTWYIPQHLYMQSENLIQSIKMTSPDNDIWSIPFNPGIHADF